ncbi:TetR family transcriptional regulator [Mesorhizobium sp. SEMIA 3007]|uniref:TetR/AcrR family transcriptional regulator n=1 Tax=Mesorhizobium jarvisii TaxID=1777867 RepID=A0A6M7TCZ2_9HYPH|nr:MULTISPECIES: TetR/AcrR family transcriptional regulator [Mesorhizobium]AID32397.1 TetR family transcriptional regulator [Mesorhizobium huakuii 7653R]ANN56978.1 TetR family transcriptional regulator [Mesorhizobium loti NZP2037]MCH4555137.1 TetR/AcrR family transcriptional regulator [Mesorhizobium jarvisii]OBQ76096.1 TetR family transcriptional regulator [Mesorhizobium loti]ODA97077.1 TetR family transcriptional regulator [Mesorhizobium sp. SEMIA 3007]
MPLSVQKRREKQKAELRSELVAAAHKLVQEEGYEGLTIRKLAKRVGYAPMSVYSYFADKQDILFALAEDAFETLARRIEEHPSDDPVEALQAVMTEYAAFGLGNPNEYRTVFMTEKTRPPEGRSFQEMHEANPAMKVLITRVEACVAAGKLQGDPRAIATMLWAVGHGTISLLITFPFYPFGDPQAFVKRMCDFQLAALSTQNVPPLTDTLVNC